MQHWSDEMERLMALFRQGYRPSDELLQLIEAVAATNDLAVDNVTIDDDERSVCLAWESNPTYRRVGRR